MSTSSGLFEELDRTIEAAGCNSNRFYDRFLRETLARQQLQLFADQYFYYIRTFPQILAGLAHRVESEEVRYQLARTVVSELGEGRPGKMHFQLFQKAMAPLGVDVAAWRTTSRIAEADALVNGIRELYLEGPTIAAIGGHYTIEQTGLPMLNSLYQGIRKYPSNSVDSLEYFYLHLVLEAEHIDWIRTALSPYAHDTESRHLITRGAARFAELLAQFWHGLERHVFSADTAVPSHGSR